MLKVHSVVKVDGEYLKQLLLVKNIKAWLKYRPVGWRKNRAESITNLTIRVDRNLTVWVNMVWSDNLNANFSYNSVQAFQTKFLEWFSHNTDIGFRFINHMSDNFVYEKTLNLAKFHAICRYQVGKDYKQTYHGDLKLFSDIHEFKTDTNKFKKWLSE